MSRPLNFRDLIVIASCATAPYVASAQTNASGEVAILPSIVVTATGF